MGMMDDFGTASNGGGRGKFEGDDSTLNDHSDSEHGGGTPAMRMYRENERRTPSETDFQMNKRKWWKARNAEGQAGHVPQSIVTQPMLCVQLFANLRDKLSA